MQHCMQKIADYFVYAESGEFTHEDYAQTKKDNLKRLSSAYQNLRCVGDSNP